MKTDIREPGCESGY